MSSIILNPFQLLELNIISAQDLVNVTRSMRTYAVAWIHPDRKLSTCIDTQGRNCPRWNDKFVFRVDDDFLASETSAVNIEIYSLHWFKDTLVGRVRVLLSNLVSPPSRNFRQQRPKGMRFAALQVRRPSGRPQGILNIGMAVLDSSMRSMPLQRELNPPPAVTRDLINQKNPNSRNQRDNPKHQQQYDQRKLEQNQPAAEVKPVLRRTKSDMSSIKRMVSFSEKPNSVINASDGASSVQGKSKKSSSAPSSMVNTSVSGLSSFTGISLSKKLLKGRLSRNSADGGSDIAGIAPDLPLVNENQYAQKVEAPAANKKWITKTEAAANRAKWAAPSPLNPLANKSKDAQEDENADVPAPKNLAIISGDGVPKKSRGKSYVTESELGLTQSELMATKHLPQVEMNDKESTMTGGDWSVVESEEGLQSKLARWRMELPPVYDRGEASILQTSDGKTTRKSGSSGRKSGSSGRRQGSSGRTVSRQRPSRRQSKRVAPVGAGLFSCAGNICGCQCSVACGNNPPAVLE